MADQSVFKLFRTVDPSTVNVQIKDKFAKLTLSSNKKKQLEKETEEELQTKGSSASRQLLEALSDTNKNTARKSYEHPLLRSDSSSSVVMGVEHTPKALQDEDTQLDVSDYMEVLQLSADGCTQRTLDADVEHLSSRVSTLTMQPQTTAQPQEISICISSTTEDDPCNDDDEESCITISDSESECDQTPAKAQQLAPAPAQEQEQEQLLVEPVPVPLTHDKVERIQAFLRDVSFERREMLRRGIVDMTHSRIASADTESMSQELDCTQRPSRPLDSSKLLADNETEVNSLCSEELAEANSSKRMADNETEANTVCSEQESSRRLADNETEANTVCSEQEQESSRRLADNETEVNTSEMEEEEPLSDLSAQLHDDTIPETCSEAEEEQSPVRPASATSTEATDETERELGTPAIQVSSINISAKINIKIHIPSMDSSSDEEAIDKYVESPPEECQEQEQQQRQEKEQSILVEDASEDEQFLTNAEQLLNQLYGKSWQTPDVIRTLKRSSGSGGKAAPVQRTPLTELRRQPRARAPAATTAKKRMPRPALPNESALGDFSIFKRALHSNANKFNSTHLPSVTHSARAAPGKRNGAPVRTNHVHEERWRALVDSDSGTEASDDEDADATDTEIASSEGGNDNDVDVDDGHVTYLDLTSAEVQVVGSPDETRRKSPAFPKRLDDILRTCSATVKPKLCATPSTPATPATPAAGELVSTRRQLFTPNIGYEDDHAAKAIVDRAIDLDNLDELAIVYLPGTTVHKRVQEVKKQLGIASDSPKAKPVFKLPTPAPTPTRTPSTTKKVKTRTPQVTVDRSGKYGFMKSLEPSVSREKADNAAYFFRENFKRNKEELAKRLYDMFNEKVFDNKLQATITWSKTLRNTAGRCRNKRRLNERMCTLELSVKVLTSADRLRCTLIHEMCHAATWLFNAEGGHGRVWKSWTYRAMAAFPELPPISVCHNYAIEFKYTYKCEACNVCSNAHSRSRKAENFRCHICRGPISLFLNKKDKQGNIVQMPVREATGFAKFVKEHFKEHKRPDLTAAQVMRILSVEYAKEKGKAGAGAAATDDLIVNQVGTLVLD